MTERRYRPTEDFVLWADAKAGETYEGLYLGRSEVPSQFDAKNYRYTLRSEKDGLYFFTSFFGTGVLNRLLEHIPPGSCWLRITFVGRAETGQKPFLFQVEMGDLTAEEKGQLEELPF